MPGIVEKRRFFQLVTDCWLAGFTSREILASKRMVAKAQEFGITEDFIKMHWQSLENLLAINLGAIKKIEEGRKQSK